MIMYYSNLVTNSNLTVPVWPRNNTNLDCQMFGTENTSAVNWLFKCILKSIWVSQYSDHQPQSVSCGSTVLWFTLKFMFPELQYGIIIFMLRILPQNDMVCPPHWSKQNNLSNYWLSWNEGSFIHIFCKHLRNKIQGIGIVLNVFLKLICSKNMEL